MLFLILLLALVSADNWAVLVAGSNGYSNYRHQADLCHAYQMLHKHGIPDDHIIIFMYDDIAFNDANPFQGNIINQPNGPNVYLNMLKDYTGKNVTPRNFINTLLGNSTVGKNLKSTSEDNVFIFMCDHGAPGLFCFPNDVLYEDDFKNTILKMKFKQLVIYMESCESGSMFVDWLLPNTTIFATSAATPFESSYACYYDDVRGTYLGDVYSVNWLQNADFANYHKETIFQQFLIDRKETNQSTVCEYGNISLAKTNTLGAFLGNLNLSSSHSDKLNLRLKIIDAVPSRRVKLMLSYKKLEKWLPRKMGEIHNNYEKFLDDLDKFNSEVSKLIEIVEYLHIFPPRSFSQPIDECLRNIVDTYFDGSPNEYQLEFLAETRPYSF